MPPRPPVANTVKLAIIWGGPNSVKATNILHAQMGAGWTPTLVNLNSVATNLSLALSAGTAPSKIIACISSAWKVNTIIATDNGGTTENAYVLPLSIPGTDLPTPVPPNCAATVSWTIPAHYRGGHPRTYLPGPAEGNLTPPQGNWWATAFRTVLATAAQSFLTSFNAALVGAATEALGTIAYARDNAPLAAPIFYPYTGGNIHQRLDSQRRRLGKENIYA